MKKYKILFAILVLVLASLACQTIMGGGRDNTQTEPLPPVDNSGGSATQESSDFSYGGDSPFPIAGDAINVVSTTDTVTYQTNLSSDEVTSFYQDEFGKLGYTEDKSLTVNFNGVFTLGFDGHESGRKILVAGAPVGDGTTSVTITLQ